MNKSFIEKDFSRLLVASGLEVISSRGHSAVSTGRNFHSGSTVVDSSPAKRFPVNIAVLKIGENLEKN